jgi:amphiphysin
MAGVGPVRASSMSSKASLDRTSSIASRKASEAYGGAAGPSSRTVAAPPPYTSTPSTDSIKKKAPPPPPPLKPKPSFGPAKVYCTALYDYEAQVCPSPSLIPHEILMKCFRAH